MDTESLMQEFRAFRDERRFHFCLRLSNYYPLEKWI